MVFRGLIVVADKFVRVLFLCHLWSTAGPVLQRCCGEFRVRGVCLLSGTFHPTELYWKPVVGGSHDAHTENPDFA